jgi:hypothetical protein
MILNFKNAEKRNKVEVVDLKPDQRFTAPLPLLKEREMEGEVAE